MPDASRARTPGAAVQRKPDSPSAASGGAGPTVAPPKGGINQAGFIDNSDGANIRTGPAESGGQKVRDQPLPPATRVFASGTHPDAPQWWYVTAYLDGTMVRGYVQDFRITTELPEPTAKLHQVVGGDTAEQLAGKEYGSSVRDGHDLRYYENVLRYVNQQQGRAGITGSYQDPGILGGGNNNVQLVAGHRIWLVSPAYAKALEAVVPSGSLTGGAVAKVGRFVGHLEDILHSVTRSPQYFGEVAGEYAQAIRDHLPEIVGIVAGFLMAEATAAFLAATPTGVGQIAATVIQLGLSAFGAAGAIQAGAEAIKHASEWLTIAWTAQGKDDRIAAASKEFLKMLVSIAIAALSALGAKANYGNALKIASSMPTGGLPALAVACGGQLGGAGTATGVLLGPGTGSLGTAGNAMMQADDKNGSGGGGPAEEAAQGPTDGAQDKTPKKAHPQDHQPTLEKAVANAPSSGLNPSETPVFRGGSSMEARPIDVKLTPGGNVRPTRGISLNTDAGKLSTFGQVRRIKSLPEGLKIVQQGKPGHYELIPTREMPLGEYQSLLNRVTFF